MSKRALRNYLKEIKKSDLEDQIMDLYNRFPAVKQYFDFVFNPKEEKLVQEAKMKISNEYFPLKRKRARARRSVAQKYIKLFLKLEMDPVLTADVMLYNQEIAQTFSADHRVPEAFYKSMLNSFKESIQFISRHKLRSEFQERIDCIFASCQSQAWPNEEDFAQALDIMN